MSCNIANYSEALELTHNTDQLKLSISSHLLPSYSAPPLSHLASACI